MTNYQHETPNIPLGQTDTSGTQFSKWHYDPADDFKGGTALDQKKNWYVRTMKNKVVQVGVIATIKDKFKYGAYFDDKQFRTNGRAIEYLLPQLKEGIVARKDLSVHSGTDFKRENEIPYVRVKKIMDHIYYDIIVEERLLEGLINEGLLGDITDEIKYGISKKIRKDLGRAIESEICNKEYYLEAETIGKKTDLWDGADDTGKAKGEWKGQYEPETRPGNWFVYPKAWFEDPDKVIADLWRVSSLMLEENTNLQKGWQDEENMLGKGADQYYACPAEAEAYENIHLIITYDIDNGLILGKYSDIKNWELIDIRKRFGRVIVTKLKNNVKMIMFQDEALKLRLKNKLENIGLEHKYEPENGANWFFAKPVAHGGLITALNYAAWVQGNAATDFKFKA